MSNILLFFDTETTGVPRDYNAPVSAIQNWPRMVQIGWALYSPEGVETGSAEHIIQPDGYTIPQAVSLIHGITTAIALEKGEKLEAVLSKFSEEVRSVEVVIGHNITFDEKIVGAEYYRCNLENLLPSKKRLCTMKLSADFCKLSGPYGYKWPKLNELYRALFQTEMSAGHTALADVRATAQCYFELRKLGVI